MKKKAKITYRQVGDYLIPNLKLPPEETKVTLGKWGILYKDHLQKHKSPLARVKAVLRRSVKTVESDDIIVGSITLKEKEHKVISDGEKVELTHKEFEMLKLFMQNPNMVFSRDKLMSEIWGMDYIGETRTVDMHIKTLRHKLGSAGGQIKTVIGVGYRLEEEA